MRFPLRPVELDFVETAPAKVTNVVELEASPEAVFDVFADGESWPQWFREIQKVTWTGPEPKDVGTTRTVELSTMAIDETFLAWDRGKRFAFRVHAASLPLFRAFAEDYRLEDLGDGRSRLTYIVAYEPALLFRIAGPLGRKIFSAMFARGSKGLQRYVRAL